MGCKWAVMNLETRTPIIWVDPAPNSTPPFPNPVSLSLIPGFLPLHYPEHGNPTGKIYMVNLSIPKKVFKDGGVTYASPYGAKSMVLLHHK